MKKILFVVLGLVLLLSACNKVPVEYNLEIADNYPIVNQLEPTYAQNELVSIQLETITEHYYSVYVNDREIAMYQYDSNQEYTYFKFIMPAEDVVVTIKDVWVDIPEVSE